MKAKELREMDESKLKSELESLLKAHFSLRMQKGMRQPVKVSDLNKLRRDIARVKTIIHEKGMKS